MDGKASGLMEKQFKNPAVTGKTERMKDEGGQKTNRQTKQKTVSALLTAANATAAMHFLWTARRGRMSPVGRAGEALPKNEMAGKQTGCAENGCVANRILLPLRTDGDPCWRKNWNVDDQRLQ